MMDFYKSGSGSEENDGKIGEGGFRVWNLEKKKKRKTGKCSFHGGNEENPAMRRRRRRSTSTCSLLFNSISLKTFKFVSSSMILV